MFKKVFIFCLTLLLVALPAQAIELLDTTSLTKIGDMTSGSGLAAAVNTGDSGSTGYKTTTSGYAGVSLTAPSAIDHADVVSATNGYDASGSTSPITLKLYGKQGSPPTSATNGTLLGTVGPFTDVNSITTKTIPSSDLSTEWDHLWVVGTTGVWTVYEATKFYLTEPAPPDNGPDPVDSERYTIESASNTATLLGYQFTHLSDFDQNVFVETPALATFDFRADTVHRGDITGYNNALSIGARIAYKCASTYAGLAGASWQYLDNVVSGENLVDRHPHHYGRILLTGAMVLQANKYYRFGIFANAATDQSPYQTTNGLAGLLVEYGKGLNLFLTDIDHGAVLVNLNGGGG